MGPILMPLGFVVFFGILMLILFVFVLSYAYEADRWRKLYEESGVKWDKWDEPKCTESSEDEEYNGACKDCEDDCGTCTEFENIDYDADYCDPPKPKVVLPYTFINVGLFKIYSIERRQDGVTEVWYRYLEDGKPKFKEFFFNISVQQHNDLCCAYKLHSVCKENIGYETVVLGLDLREKDLEILEDEGCILQ